MLRARDWENLLWNVRRGRSVLFVGPEPGGSCEAATAGLARHLADLLREEGRTVLGQSLPAVAQQFEDDPHFGRSDLEREVARFHEAHGPAEAGLQASLVALPFPLYVTSCHDTALEQALRAIPDKHLRVGRYHFRGLNPPVTSAFRPQAPLLYYLHGAISEPASLVVTERDLLEFLEKIIAQRPGVPDAIAAHLQKRDTTFLFLGFGLRHPYLRVLLHALRVNQDDRSLAVEEGTPPPAPDDTVLFYERGKITLYDAEVESFVAELARRFREAGGAIAQAEPEQAAVRPRVFISYASEDAPHARRLWEGLGQAGFDAWLDKERLEGGDRWDPAIEHEIRRSDYVLVLQSRALAAKADSYVNKEIALARERSLRVADPYKCLIPLQIEPSERRPDLESYQAEPLGPERYDEDLKRLVSLITRDYQLRQREGAS